jgi:hypothetical protein
MAVPKKPWESHGESWDLFPWEKWKRHQIFGGTFMIFIKLSGYFHDETDETKSGKGF